MALTGGTDQKPSAGSIVTPEAVVLDFELAGVASRAIAISIDIAVQVIAMLALALVIGLIGQGSGVVGIVLLLVSIILVVIGYPVAMETLNRGRSLGRMAVGTRVVTVEGAPVRFRHAFIRALLAIVDLLASSGAIAVVSALLTQRGQRLGDLVAGTMVIRERKSVGQGWSVPFFPAPGLVEWAKPIDTAPLGDDGYQIIRDYLRRDELSSLEHGPLADDIEAFVNERLPLWPRPAGHRRVDWLRTIAAAAQGSMSAAPAPSGPSVSLPPPPGVAAAHNTSMHNPSINPSGPPPPPSVRPTGTLPPPPVGVAPIGTLPPPPSRQNSSTSPPPVPPPPPAPAPPARTVTPRETPQRARTDGFAPPG